jgi:putative addiction module component (TIGR02574 family)
MEPEKIVDQIKKLSLPQRLILVQDTWDSIALESGNLTMPDWQKKELDKRYGQYKDGELALHDWQEVHKELREKFK